MTEQEENTVVELCCCIRLDDLRKIKLGDKIDILPSDQSAEVLVIFYNAKMLGALDSRMFLADYEKCVVCSEDVMDIINSYILMQEI